MKASKEPPISNSKIFFKMISDFKEVVQKFELKRVGGASKVTN